MEKLKTRVEINGTAIKLSISFRSFECSEVTLFSSPSPLPSPTAKEISRWLPLKYQTRALRCTTCVLGHVHAGLWAASPPELNGKKKKEKKKWFAFPCSMILVHGLRSLCLHSILWSVPFLHSRPLNDLRGWNQRKQFCRAGLIFHVCDNSSRLHLLNLAPEESSRARLIPPCLAKPPLPPVREDTLTSLGTLNSLI